MAGGWLTCASIDLNLDVRRFWLEIPTGFTDMQHAGAGAGDGVAHAHPRHLRDLLRAAATRSWTSCSNRSGGIRAAICLRARRLDVIASHPGGQAIGRPPMHVQVQVEHRLARLRVAVDDGAKAAAVVAALPGDRGRPPDHRRRPARRAPATDRWPWRRAPSG